MRSTSAAWQAALAADALSNIRVTIGSSVYGYDRIDFCNISGELFADHPTIGGAVATELDITLINPGTIPRMAQILVESTLEGLTDEWLPQGTFFVDTRRTEYGGKLTLHAYDAMLKGDQPFTAASYPIATSAALAYIAGLLGVSIEAATLAYATGRDYDITLDRTYTAREVLGFIGASWGGSFIISPANELRFVPLASTTAGQDLGLKMQALTMGSAITISGVQLTFGDESYTNGDDSTYLLTAECPWATPDMMADLYSALVLNGCVYQAFDASGALLDLAAELGDVLTINGVSCPLISVAWRLAPGWDAAISAPNDQEVDHEYPYASQTARDLQRTQEDIADAVSEAETRFNTSFEQTDERISAVAESIAEVELTVNGDATQTGLVERTTALEQTAGGIEVSISELTRWKDGDTDAGDPGAQEIVERFGLTTDGLTINRNTSDIYAVYGNESASFRQDTSGGDAETLAEFAASGATVPALAAPGGPITGGSASLEESVSIGIRRPTTTPYYLWTWICEADGSLSLIRNKPPA